MKKGKAIKKMLGQFSLFKKNQKLISFRNLMQTL